MREAFACLAWQLVGCITGKIFTLTICTVSGSALLKINFPHDYLFNYRSNVPKARVESAKFTEYDSD